MAITLPIPPTPPLMFAADEEEVLPEVEEALLLLLLLSELVAVVDAAVTRLVAVAVAPESEIEPEALVTAVMVHEQVEL